MYQLTWLFMRVWSPWEVPTIVNFSWECDHPAMRCTHNYQLLLRVWSPYFVLTFIDPDLFWEYHNHWIVLRVQSTSYGTVTAILKNLCRGPCVCVYWQWFQISLNVCEMQQSSTLVFKLINNRMASFSSENPASSQDAIKLIVRVSSAQTMKLLVHICSVLAVKPTIQMSSTIWIKEHMLCVHFMYTCAWPESVEHMLCAHSQG